MVARSRRILAACLLSLTARAAFAAGPENPAPVDERNPGDEAGGSVASEDLSPGELAAREAFEEGLRSLRDGRWADAEQRFRASLAIVRRESTEYNLAFVVYMQHRPRECLRILEPLIEPNATVADARYHEYAALLRLRAQADVSTLRLLVTPSTALVFIDGEPARARASERWLEIEPGRHEAKVTAPGFVAQRIELAVRPGMELERDVVLAPAATRTPPLSATNPSGAPAEPSSYMPWVLVGTGGALLVAGVVTGVIAMEADSDFRKQCPSNKDCPASLDALRDRVITFGQTTDVLLVSGGVLVASGLTWRLLVPPAKAGGAHAAFVTVSGRF